MFKLLFFVVAIAGAVGAYMYYFHKTPSDVRDDLMHAGNDLMHAGNDLKHAGTDAYERGKHAGTEAYERGKSAIGA